MNKVKVIYKYRLYGAGEQQLILPEDYQILSVQLQDGTPTMWVLVDPDKFGETVTLETVGTGHIMLESDEFNREYINTYQEGSYVWHLFKRVKKR